MIHLRSRVLLPASLASLISTLIFTTSVSATTRVIFTVTGYGADVPRAREIANKLRVSTDVDDLYQPTWVQAPYGEMNDDLDVMTLFEVEVPVLNTGADRVNRIAPTPTVIDNYLQISNVFWTLSSTITSQSAYARASPSMNATKVASLFLGEKYTAIGQSANSEWLQIRLKGHDEPRWIASFVAKLSGEQDLLATTAKSPETSPVYSATSVPTQPSTAPRVGPFTLQLGGQVSDFRYPDLMKQAGMTWVKRQARWHPDQPASSHFDTIKDAHSKGFKILLSVLGHADEARQEHFYDYAQFVGELAAAGADGIEVWNEMNLPREWAEGFISATTYSNLLQQAYTSIKAANPETLVISGAPAPTGYFGGCYPHGCDDAAFISDMVAAGALRYLDCIGVHYNEGLVPPADSYGDPRGASGHYTRYYQGMVDTYYITAGGQKPLCFTELGYLSGEEWGMLPEAFLWAPPYNLSVAEHAQHLADAVQQSRRQGKVLLLIIFNVDFTFWGDDPQAGYAMVRPGGACPACITISAAMSE